MAYKMFMHMFAMSAVVTGGKVYKQVLKLKFEAITRLWASSKADCEYPLDS
uniref:hypothetical protein n=1 Tax=Agathobacter sp. TaxID=2021311 RepID=UPI004055E0A3